MPEVVGGAPNGGNDGGTAAVSESMAEIHGTPGRFLLREGRGRRGGAVELLVGARGGRRRRGFVGDGDVRVRFSRGIEREIGCVCEGEEGEKLEHGFQRLVPSPGARGRRGLAAAIDGARADSELVPVERKRRPKSENPPATFPILHRSPSFQLVCRKITEDPLDVLTPS